MLIVSSDGILTDQSFINVRSTNQFSKLNTWIKATFNGI